MSTDLKHNSSCISVEPPIRTAVGPKRHVQHPDSSHTLLNKHRDASASCQKWPHRRQKQTEPTSPAAFPARVISPPPSLPSKQRDADRPRLQKSPTKLSDSTIA